MADPTREQFDAAASRVAATAPAGLSREQFFALIDKELGKPAPLAPTRQGTSSGLVLAGAGEGTALAARGVEEFATNPNVPKIAAKVGRVLGGAAPVVGGLSEFGLGGGMLGVAGVAKGAWAGGKTGWFTGKMFQGLAAPVANVLHGLTPYMLALNRFAGPQSALDLAQLADPTRRDIGVLGIGPSAKVEGAHPPLVNMAVQKVGAGLEALKGLGVPPEQAAEMLIEAFGRGLSTSRGPQER